MNYAGLQTPLAARLVTVASNSSLRMLYSWLYLTGETGEGLTVGGEVDQDESSVVTGSQADVGWIGPGVYNLKSGALALNQLFLGGAFGGQFNQYDGSCEVGLLQLYTNGAYNYYGGADYPTNIYFLGGTFFIRDGIRERPIETGNYVQTGGNNYAPVGFSHYSTPGSYTLSNGVSFIPNLPIQCGSYSQWGGSQTVTGMVFVNAYAGGPRIGPVIGGMGIYGGSFSCSGIYVAGHYDQSGGTNIVHGTITVDGVLGILHQEGGVLVDDDVVVNSAASYSGDEFRQCGGLHVINNQLTIDGLLGAGSGAPVCPP
jgi:hypothetical protein